MVVMMVFVGGDGICGGEVMLMMIMKFVFWW